MVRPKVLVRHSITGGRSWLKSHADPFIHLQKITASGFEAHSNSDNVCRVSSSEPVEWIMPAESKLPETNGDMYALDLMAHVEERQPEDYRAHPSFERVSKATPDQITAIHIGIPTRLTAEEYQKRVAFYEKNIPGFRKVYHRFGK